MPRSVNHVASRARRKKILKRVKGQFGARKNVWTVAKNAYEKGLTYAFVGRRRKKRESGQSRVRQSCFDRHPTVFYD